jgi:hypothetical protein
MKDGRCYAICQYGELNEDVCSGKKQNWLQGMVNCPSVYFGGSIKGPRKSNQLSPFVSHKVGPPFILALPEMQF